MFLSLPFTAYFSLERLNNTYIDEVLLDTVRENLKH